MPIEIQSNLPAAKILEQENIFVMDEGTSLHAGHSPPEDLDPQYYAHQNSNGNTAFAVTGQYPAAINH